MKDVTTEQIEEIAANLAHARDTFLREKGWEFTCQTPGCYWMWQKTIPDGRTVLVTGDFAMSIEEHWANVAEAEREAAQEANAKLSNICPEEKS